MGEDGTLGIHFILWNYNLFKNYKELFNIQVYHRPTNNLLRGSVYRVPSDLKCFYDKERFMVLDSSGVYRIWPVSEIILKIPEELFSIFSDLKPINFSIQIIKNVKI